jgi:putative ABC transport system permease protein
MEFDIPFTVEGLEASSPTERPRAAYRAVLPGYFRSMRIPLIHGRLLDGFDVREGRNVVLINESLATRYFAEIEPLGRTLTVPMLDKVEIVGVVGDVLHSGLQANAEPELYVPYQLLPLREMHMVMHTAEEPSRMASAVKAEIQQIDPEQPVTGIYAIDELLSGSVVQPRFNMALVMGLAFCAVVLAAVGIYGVVSYSVAQRTREIGLRMALGAQAGDTVRLIVGQALKVVILGAVVGFAGAFASVRLIQSLLFGVSATDPITYVVAVATVVAAGLIAPLAPAIRAARVDPVVALREQ